MKVTKVYGHLKSIIRLENEFVLTMSTECNYAIGGNIYKSQRTIEISFDVQSTNMNPIGDYEQSCMALLEEFDDVSILQEEENRIRESYFIGKMMDEISYDILVYTKLTKHYIGTFELENNNLN